MAANEDTGRTDMQGMTLDLLKEIRDRLAHIEERQEAMEKRIEQVVTDLNVVHQFQQSLGERLSIVEKFCMGQPLRSRPSPVPKADDGHGGR
jgi:DNA anti-recombination protein RmuC